MFSENDDEIKLRSFVLILLTSMKVVALDANHKNKDPNEILPKSKADFEN